MDLPLEMLDAIVGELRARWQLVSDPSLFTLGRVNKLLRTMVCDAVFKAKSADWEGLELDPSEIRMQDDELCAIVCSLDLDTIYYMSEWRIADMIGGNFDLHCSLAARGANTVERRTRYTVGREVIE